MYRFICCKKEQEYSVENGDLTSSVLGDGQLQDSVKPSLEQGLEAESSNFNG